MDSREIRCYIRNYYRSLFEGTPAEAHSRLPIPTGRSLAEALGYPMHLFGAVPKEYWPKFLPCGNPLPYIDPRPGERILNLGCGAGLDTLALRSMAGSSVEIVSLDIVFDILRDASAVESRVFPARPGSFARGLRVCADGGNLPFHPECFDWVLMNGVFNLFPDKSLLLDEIRKVLQPSGRFVCTDLCAATSLPDYFDAERDAWAWCMSGACTEDGLKALLLDAGFRRVVLVPEEERDMFYRVAFTCMK